MQGMDIGMFNHTSIDKSTQYIVDPVTGQIYYCALGQVNCVEFTMLKSAYLIANALYSAHMENKYRSEGKLTTYNSNGQVIGSYHATSGCSKSSSGPYYTLPSGDYVAHGFETSTDPKFMRNGIGFKIRLDPNPVWDPTAGYSRTNLLIHPTRLNGTQGCIGLIPRYGDQLPLLDFQSNWNNSIFVNRSIPLHVAYSPYY